MNIQELSNEDLINLYKENNYSLSQIDNTYKLSKDTSWRLFNKKNINFKEIKRLHDIEIYNNYINNPKRCKNPNCSKELDWSHRMDSFCSNSCATSYNNSHRNKEIYKNLSNTLKKFYINNSISKKVKSKSVIKIKNINKFNKCLNCNIEFKGNGKFCSCKCSAEYRHKLKYKEYLNNPDSYCRGNYTPRPFKNDFLKEQDNKCAICGISPEWNNKPLVFILDHIDGNASNNKRSNLRMICPNCDTQLDTFKSKNKNSTRRNYWKENIIKKALVSKEELEKLLQSNTETCAVEQ